MLVNTKVFGEIEIDEEKIVTFEDGIIGFPELKHFSIIFDEEKRGKTKIYWLQCIEDGQFALPVMNPTIVKEDYNPYVEDELLKPLGTLNESNLCVLVTVNVPRDIQKMSVNLKAPMIINIEEQKGAQLIVEDDYPVRYEVYELFKNMKEQEGE